MNQFFYFILYGISKLPLGILYIISDFSFVILYYLIGYRKTIVLNNLKKSFPHKSEQELLSIRKKFFKNLCDYGIETIKAFSISQKELNKRHTISNLEIFEKHKNAGTNVFMLNGHVFNWEWYVGIVEHLPMPKTFAIYHVIHNQFWNEKINQIRSRFGTIPLEMNETARAVIREPNDGNSVYLFVADQSPYIDKIQYELEFLNQPTPVFNGFDGLARKKNIAVVYAETTKVKRGYYHTSFTEIKPKNDTFEPNEIVHQFFDLLENTIEKDPANWLWSHKRWKYRMKK